ncbi:DUF6234 family protein [Streptomyces spectabilis]|uniref:Peptidoglycan/LPS O-acetylase OafA/YrhL n=1 Tax=Streptomyces spectabilis TaxID=68270 RepID=A0A5P2X5U5_STRST|nr:DUF6234 family protein [Streptomyces spectabilis]MBB5108232.1 peptidoglycan/LPS O-acetylase OafA/YrhL [Streptomyces spectabilis]MCI3900994.1 DUF6234 family protein [Streptomyces spectabilis]QEV58495.1 hypothetical protein CP982_07065 [Streptomyces spectabilis]GGV45356.1 hypothetical protein GCM10010245_70930 [Streptomyces spectabilis]
MDLPIAPPAFDASARTRADTGPDVGAAVGLLVAEVLVLAGIVAVWIASGLTFDPAADAEFDRLDGYLAASACVGGLALLATVVAIRVRAPVTAWSQGFMVVVIAAAVLAGFSYQRHEDEVRGPAPAWTGQVGCRSGGDSDECAATGG